LFLSKVSSEDWSSQDMNQRLNYQMQTHSKIVYSVVHPAALIKDFAVLSDDFLLLSLDRHPSLKINLVRLSSEPNYFLSSSLSSIALKKPRNASDGGKLTEEEQRLKETIQALKTSQERILGLNPDFELAKEPLKSLALQQENLANQTEEIIALITRIYRSQQIKKTHLHSDIYKVIELIDDNRQREKKLNQRLLELSERSVRIEKTIKLFLEKKSSSQQGDSKMHEIAERNATYERTIKQLEVMIKYVKVDSSSDK
jgi:hypothetical protein